MTPSTPRPSYRALLEIPTLGRILLGMALGRTAGAMVAVALVLFTLNRFADPALAGIVTFANIMPGLLVSPVAGALLDRHGRRRLIILDHLVAAGSLALLGALALTDALTAPLLVAIAVVAGLTAPLSGTGLRSLFPVLVPRHLWERVNAVDSNGYVLASLLGPPMAGVLVQGFGGPPALFAIAALFAVSSVVFVGVADPRTPTASTGRLLLDAWRGLGYTLANPTLRALGLSVSVQNLGSGVLTILVPVIVLERLAMGEAVAGLAWAVSAVFGGAAAFVFGRWSTEGRERPMLVIPMVGIAGVTALLLLPPSLALLMVVMAINGFMYGPMDIALFTLRQRRTDPAWMGRAFAVSMSFNYLGYPIGAAVAGVLVTGSLEDAVLFAVGAALLGAAIGWILLPDERLRPARGRTTALADIPVENGESESTLAGPIDAVARPRC
jgi:MFS family permease